MNNETYEPGAPRGSDFEPKSRFAPEHGLDEPQAFQNALTTEVLDSISDAFYAVDGKWRLTFVNRIVEQWWGRSRAELIGRNLWDEFPQAIGSESYQAHLTAAKERKAIRIETPSPILGRWVDVRITPITGDGLAVYFSDITERKRAEEALLDSEARLRSAILAAPFPIMLYAGDGEVLVLSRKWTELTGYTRQEMKTRFDWTRLAFGDARERFEAEMPDQFEGERAAGEWEVRAKDGSTRVWDLLHVALGQLPDGRRLQMAAAVDVTERKAAEAALKASEVRLARKAGLLELSHDAILVWDLDGGAISFWNRAAEDLYGFTREEALGRRTHDLLQTKLPMTARQFDSMLERKRSWAGELVHTTKDGRRITVESRHVLFTEADGRTTVLETNRDVTARKRAEERLRKLNETLEAQVAERTRERDMVWRTSKDLFAIIGPDNRYRAVNPAWSAALGYSTEELIGMDGAALVHPDDVLAKAEELAPLGRREGVRDVDLRIRTKAGDWRWFSWTATPAGNDEVYAEGRDITERKMLEEQLRQAQKMEAVGQLTGGIAHDFNNLLTGIIGSLELLQKRLDQGRTRDLEKYASAAMTSANRAAALTHRLLAFSRRQPLDPKPVDANRLIASMEDLLRRTIRETVHVELILAGGLWRTLCDPHQLESAILNLAINARDAMPNGGKLTIETCNAHLDRAYAAGNSDVRPGQYVCICVSDTGTGMTPDIVARAFDPFFTTKPTGQGTGLGLSMIYGFVRQSEGHVKIYSEPGAGTTVKLYLPRHHGDAHEDSDTAPMLADVRSPGGEVVIVVEDDQAVRDLVLEVLRDVGYSALVAADGPSGLALIQQAAKVDLMITDVGLPGLNGRQLADAARELRPELKVLFMTGYAENAAISSGFLEPGMEIITKPFPLDMLAARVRQMLEAARA